MNERRSGSGWKLFALAPCFLLVGLVFSGSVSAQDTLDLEKAVKVGSGKTMVVEFTDPDCPYCRNAEAYLQGKQQQVTRYIYFFPLAMHPEAKTKVQYILSAKDKTKAYLDVLTGHFDSGKAAASITPEGVKLQQEHLDIARGYKIDAVPTFLIYGRIVKGFDPNKLDALIK
jgi:thiol:disulfide interchange protein DsbC